MKRRTRLLGILLGIALLAALTQIFQPRRRPDNQPDRLGQEPSSPGSDHGLVHPPSTAPSPSSGTEQPAAEQEQDEALRLECRAVDDISGAPVRDVRLLLAGRFPTDWTSEIIPGGVQFCIPARAAEDPRLTLSWIGEGWLAGRESVKSIVARSTLHADGHRTAEIRLHPAKGDEILVRAVSKADESPIEGVVATRIIGSGRNALFEPLAATDADGHAELSIRQIGGRRVILRKPGYMPAVIHPGDSPRDLGNVPLVRDRWRSRLHIVVPNAPPDCLIRVKRIGPDMSSPEFRAATENQFCLGGGWMLDLLPLGGSADDFNLKGNEWDGSGLVPGDYVVAVTATEAGCFYRELQLENDDIKLEARLVPGATVRVALDSGREMVKRYILESNAGLGARVSGSSRLENVLPGEYTVCFELEGGTRVKTGSVLRITDHSLVDVVVPTVGPLLNVRGRLLLAFAGDAPRPAAAAHIKLSGCNVEGRTDERGFFILRQVPPGKYTLRSSEYRRAQFSLQIPELADGEVVDLGDVVLRIY